MVGLDTLSTPPAIEQTIPRDDTHWARGTVGALLSKKTNGETREDEEVESTVFRLHGTTSAGMKRAVDSKSVAAPENTPREKVRTAAFSEYLFNRRTGELVSLLDDLKPNLHRIEGAGIMVAFRRLLEQIWHVAGRLPKEKVLIVSAVEEAVRNTKWRELSVGQVDVLQRVLSNVNTPADVSRAEMARAFRALNKSRIDVFPSALIEEEDDELDSNIDIGTDADSDTDAD
jgi:hypothetical protein